METGEVEGVREVWACVPGCPVRVLDEQSGSSRSTKGKPRKGRKGAGWGMEHTGTEHADSGGASRFFYIAKANRSEREEGLRGHIACVKCGGVDTTEHPTTHGAENCIRNNHPTVKPIDLMRYLCRLVTPPGGLVLDPFAGSGTTGIAAALESCRFLGFEQEPGYVEIARVRIRHWAEQNMQIELSVGA
jgi:site-specific DNA-methyltransferase (adenine-specific)